LIPGGSLFIYQTPLHTLDNTNISSTSNDYYYYYYYQPVMQLSGANYTCCKHVAHPPLVQGKVPLQAMV
jgi:predicted chitinase